MTIRKIYDEDIESLKVASLPSRPTAPTAFGGAGFTAKDMKGAFDRLPLFIISRLNELIDLLSDSDGVIDIIPSGIDEEHTLKDLTRDISSGRFSTYLSVLGEPLSEKILAINEKIERIEIMLASIDNGPTQSGTAMEALNLRITDLEGSVTELLESLSSLSDSIDDRSAEILAAALETSSSANEELEGRIRESIGEAINDLSNDINDCKDILTDRIDVLYAKLEGIHDLEIDCGGPGDL